MYFSYDDPIQAAPAGSAGGGFFGSFTSALGAAAGAALPGLLFGQDENGKTRGVPMEPGQEFPGWSRDDTGQGTTLRWRRKALQKFDPGRGGFYAGAGRYGRLPAELEGIQPGGEMPREYDGKLRIPGWRWPLTYPAAAIQVLYEAMTLAVQDYVTEDTLKKVLQPINWKMAHQMAHDIRTGSELAQDLFGKDWGQDTPVDKSRGLAILALVLQDKKPRRRRRRVVPKYVERFFDKLGDMRKVVNKFYDPMGAKMKRPPRRSKRR
jgi:hypothetical protein